MGTEHVRWLAESDTTDRVTDPVPVTDPVMVLAFTGWNDAGDSASTALRTMVESWAATPLAEIDPEVFTDFATVRPQVRLDAQRRRSIIWPTVGVWSARLPGADVLLVLGPEPALRWRSFGEQILGIAERYGTSMAITLGALLADVPHNRSVPLIGTASDESVMQRFDLARSQYEGPTGIVGVLQAAFADRGLASASLWAAVPGYAAQIPSPKAALALLERACTMIGTPAPTGVLADQARAYDAHVEASVDDDLADYLEQFADDEDDLPPDDESGGGADDSGARAAGPAGPNVDPDTLVEEVEKFLRDQD